MPKNRTAKKASLADYIGDDMALCIVNTGKAPCNLTLSAISTHYKVSLSPVRAAVERLIGEGYLAALDTGRLALGNARKNRSKRLTRTAPSAPIDYELVIQSDVIRMSLQGTDGFLREEWATNRYGIGRTALRPILSRLAGQDLIEKVPRRGWRIRPFDESDLCSFVEVRELLELRALELAIPRLERDKLLHLLNTNKSRETQEESALNNQLHEYWIMLSGNHYIRRFFQRDAVYYRTLFDYAAPEAHVVSEMAAQHCEILEDLLAKKWTSAKRALSEHIQAQKPIVKSLIEKLNSSRE